MRFASTLPCMRTLLHLDTHARTYNMHLFMYMQLHARAMPATSGVHLAESLYLDNACATR